MIKKLPPTKSNLFKLQQDLGFAREGFTLLDRKREVLIMEMMQVIHTIKNLQRRLVDQMELAYDDFRHAYVEMGSEEIERANFAWLDRLDIHLTERSVMGVSIPEVKARNLAPKSRIGIMNTSFSFNSAVEKFQETIPLLLEYTQANLTLTRLATEIQKTQKRVNALEYMFIPDTEETIKHISDILEESEREDFFRRKQVKKTITN